MPRFGLRKALDVGRGVKVFLNLQAGATRGEVPDPWNRNHPSRQLSRKDKQIFRLKNKVKNQDRELFQLRNRLAAAEERQVAPPSFQASNEGVGALPDYVIIGAQRCGTTRFYGLLTEHPLIKRAAAKELHFFDRSGHLGGNLEWYKQCFPPPEWQDGQRTITGEATPRYLFEPRAPERMARVIPEVRLIVLLRNPVDRTYSQYHKAVRNGKEQRSFEETVEDELTSLDDASSSGPALLPEDDDESTYNRLARGIYVDQLARWQQFFPKKQILVIKSEDFYEDATGTLETAWNFLGLSCREFMPSPAKMVRTTNYEYKPMNPSFRERLETFFEPHNRRLYDFLGRDFGW